RGRAVLGEQPTHDPHRTVDVVEEVLEAGAEVVEAGVAGRGFDEAVLGTAAVTREAHVALEAIGRQAVALVEAELALPLGGDELERGGGAYVAELVAGLDEVVAGVEVACVLAREREPARLRVDAEAWRLAHP